MKEVKIQLEGKEYRFRENTDIGTYYQVFGLEELKMIIAMAGLGTLSTMWKEAEEMMKKGIGLEDQKISHSQQRKVVASRLFEAITVISQKETKRV
jgi:hypothetical protein